MIKIFFGRSKHVHIMNRLSIYWCNYLKCLDKEYWQGFNRRKIFGLGKLSVWIRDNG